MSKLIITWILLQSFLKVSLSIDNFERWDLDGNGGVSLNEFQYFAERMPMLKGENLPKDQFMRVIKVIFKEHDTDRNKELSPK
jgi:hypothetical protein